MQFSKTNLRNPLGVLNDPLAAAATFTEDYNITELTEKVGCRSNKTLLAKLNNDHDFHALNLTEAVKITEVTGDHRIVKAWANGLGFVMLPSIQAGVTDEEVSDQLLTMQERMGEYCKTIRLARENGIITAADHASIKKASISLIESIMQLEAEMGLMVRNVEEAA